MALDAALARAGGAARRRRAWPDARGRGARHPRDRRQQHGRRDPRRLGRARARSARLHAGALRRRRAAAWLRAGGTARHHAACWCRRAPGVLCAQGLLAADLKAEFSRTVAQPLAERRPCAAGCRLHRAGGRGRRPGSPQEAVAAPDRSDPPRRPDALRGAGPRAAVPWPSAGGLAALGADFAAAHRALYGFDLPAIAVEIVTLRVEAAGALPVAGGAMPRGGEPARRRTPASGRSPAARGGRRRRRSSTAPASAPAPSSTGRRSSLQLDATTLVAPGWQARVDASGALLLRR